MLRKIRITLAVLFFIAATLLFLDYTGTLHAYLGWVAQIQLVPAVLALNFAVVAVLILLTLVFGRFYCSVICPLGVFQDIVSRLGSLFNRKHGKYRFGYRKALPWLRYTLLALFIAAMVAGAASLAALIEPYSTFGRMVQNLLSPVYQGLNNIAAAIAERAHSYAFYRKDVWIRSLPTFIIAAVTFVALLIAAWFGGRAYCNSVCPVGTVLGFLSRFAWMKPVIGTDKCNGCGLCAKACKASCIHPQTHRIDYSRCVGCMDCLENCRQKAIFYGHPTKTEKGIFKVDTSRRNFLTGAGLVLGVAAAQAGEKTVDGGLAVISDKKIPTRTTPVIPPGAQSLKHFQQHCIACQLCVSVCPNNVLRPSASLQNLMQPQSSYERGYCRSECTRCGEVCPTGAIKPIDKAEKTSIRIGHAVWVGKNCVVLTDGVECGNCARHCPTGAIQMVPSVAQDPASPKIPAIHEENCIGCGACENLCPARPFSAIYVEGHEVHGTR